MEIDNILQKILSEDTASEAKKYFYDAINTGMDFKLNQDVRNRDIGVPDPSIAVSPMPEKGETLEAIIAEFKSDILPYCFNFSSPNFMGFPDAGNSTAAITGNIMADFLQQNLINQSFCSPSGTYIEIAVIRWLREIIGYTNPEKVNNIFDTGGVITVGGTLSNTIGILLARENYRAETMKNGVDINDDHYLIIPKGIGHYSVKSAQMWVGCGNRLIEVETENYRYDLKALEAALRKYKGKIMGLVAYAGDSRTMTVEHFDKVATLAKSIDKNIWLHADACHGFSLGFSETLSGKLKGIEIFDSITTDPHKVMNTPYTLSALLVRDPKSMELISSTSDLIMQEQFAFGQITPFIGSKSWMSLKLWFAFKNLGKSGYGDIIDNRHKLALELAEMINKSPDFKLINDVDINAVAFVYDGGKKLTVDMLNTLNKELHETILNDGKYHLHQFSIPDAGVFKKDATIYPLRYMSGNPLLTQHNLSDMLSYVRKTAQQILKQKS